MRETPKNGEFYRHFKDKMYQIITLAKHSEDGEVFVIYQALYGDFTVYARPLPMFMSEVDREKYPQVKQKYRFEKVEMTKVETEQEEHSGNETVVRTLEEKMMEFFDTEDYEIRSNLLISMKSEMTDLMVDNLAVALDVVIPEGELSQRFEQLQNCLKTKKRYESDRIR